MTSLLVICIHDSQLLNDFSYTDSQLDSDMKPLSILGLLYLMTGIALTVIGAQSQGGFAAGAFVIGLAGIGFAAASSFPSWRQKILEGG